MENEHERKESEIVRTLKVTLVKTPEGVYLKEISALGFGEGRERNYQKILEHLAYNSAITEGLDSEVYLVLRKKPEENKE